MEFKVFDCIKTAQNTGTGFCPPEFGKMLTEIILVAGTVITKTQLDTLFTTLSALLTNDSVLVRGYRAPIYVTITDSTADPVTEGFDFGVNIVIGDSAVTIERRFIAGGLCAQVNMRRLNGQAARFEFLQVFQAASGGGYFVAGRRTLNSTTGEEEMRGFNYDEFFTRTWGYATGTTKQMFRTMSVMGDVEQLNSNMLYTKIDWNPKDLPGIMNVNLNLQKSSTGVFDVLAVLDCGGSNLATLYPALAATGAWIVLNNLGNAVTITGVTIVGGKFRLALDTADADYTAGTSFTAQLAALSVTSGAPYNVKYIESGISNAVAK